ncbi:hypothetical protein QFZ73_002323 [Peribacillus sp. V2I11]|nr:hypothetical protein [Peribacillus sp. V2I11]
MISGPEKATSSINLFQDKMESEITNPFKLKGNRILKEKAELEMSRAKKRTNHCTRKNAPWLPGNTWFPYGKEFQ